MDRRDSSEIKVSGIILIGLIVVLFLFGGLIIRGELPMLMDYLKGMVS